MKATALKVVTGLLTVLSFAAINLVSVANAMDSGKTENHQTQKNSESTRYTFERHTFNVSRQRGHVFFNEYWYSHPLTEQQQLVRLIEVFDHQNFESNRDFMNWAKTLRGTRTYTYDTVKIHRPNGVTNLGPLVLLSENQRAEVNPMWRLWRDKEESRLENLAQQRREAEIVQAKQKAELETTRLLAQAATESARSLSVISGSTSLWEVELQPLGHQNIWFPNASQSLSFSKRAPYGAFNLSTGTSKYVRTYGRNSLAAGQQALSNNPNYQLGTIRRVSRY